MVIVHDVLFNHFVAQDKMMVPINHFLLFDIILYHFIGYEWGTI